MSATKTKSPFDGVAAAIESAGVVDGPAKLVASAVRGSVSGALKEVLSGTWLGHALHPLLTDVVIGSLMSATAVDLLAGKSGEQAAERLIMLGIAAYPPTALSGASDWADASVDDAVRRVGIVHATGNVVGLSLYGASLRERRRGNRGRGKLLGLAGLGVMSVGAYLGAHMSMRQGIGPDQTVFDPGPGDWTRATETSQLQDGKPLRVVVDDTPVLLVKHGPTIHAIHDRCSHRGCSLAEGKLDGEAIVCGCHGSRFDLRDGSLLAGPATAPQPAYDVREQDGKIELRLQP
jgi:nitrite reductase/ring-hydroxylating ferredoxin subunit/uncharacterized membrane protein